MYCPWIVWLSDLVSSCTSYATLFKLIDLLDHQFPHQLYENMNGVNFKRLSTKVNNLIYILDVLKFLCITIYLQIVSTKIWHTARLGGICLQNSSPWKAVADGSLWIQDHSVYIVSSRPVTGTYWYPDSNKTKQSKKPKIWYTLNLHGFIGISKHTWLQLSCMGSKRRQSYPEKCIDIKDQRSHSIERY